MKAKIIRAIYLGLLVIIVVVSIRSTIEGSYGSVRLMSALYSIIGLAILVKELVGWKKDK